MFVSLKEEGMLMNCNDVVLIMMPRAPCKNHVLGNCNGVLLN